MYSLPYVCHVTDPGSEKNHTDIRAFDCPSNQEGGDTTSERCSYHSNGIYGITGTGIMIIKAWLIG